MIFESARISTRLLLEDLGLSANDTESRREAIRGPVDKIEVAV